MPDRYKKIQPKLKPLPFIIIGVVLVAVIVLVLVLRETPKEKFYNEYTAYGAKELEKKHVFKEISYKTLKKKIDKEEKLLVYIGAPTCRACIEEVPLYDKEFTAEDLNIGEYLDCIYYVDTRKLSSSQTEEITNEYFYSPEQPLFLYFAEGELAIDRYMFTSSQTTQGNIHLFLKEVLYQLKK